MARSLPSPAERFPADRWPELEAEISRLERDLAELREAIRRLAEIRAAEEGDLAQMSLPLRSHDDGRTEHDRH